MILLQKKKQKFLCSGLVGLELEGNYDNYYGQSIKIRVCDIRWSFCTSHGDWETSGLQECQYIAFNGYSGCSRSQRWKTTWSFDCKIICNMKILGIPIAIMPGFQAAAKQNQSSLRSPCSSLSLTAFPGARGHWDAEDVFTLCSWPLLLCRRCCFMLMEDVWGHCWMCWSSLLSLRPCAGCIFLRRATVKSTGHEPHRRFVGACRGIAENKLTPA